ncbi:MAG: VanW family protein [Armatimonas sp.]
MNPNAYRIGGAFVLTALAGAAFAQTDTADKLAVNITLTDGKTTITRTRRELGFQLNTRGGVQLFAIDPAALKSALTRISPKFQQDAINARLGLNQKQVTLVPGAYARKLDIEQTAKMLLDTVGADPTVTHFTVALTKTPPPVSDEKLQGITAILGQMTTHTSAVPKRNINIGIATQAIDGTLLAPGETFSLNHVVGERTQARGYRTATVFENGLKTPGIGGGVSQVTGTLFNAAALAGLTIREVNPHSRPVAYLPLGRDATVAYGTKDLKFTNNTGSPVYISYTFQGNTLRAILFGAPVGNRQVTLTPRSRTLGEGKIRAELYRTIRQDGKVVSKERLLRHLYQWRPGT